MSVDIYNMVKVGQNNVLKLSGMYRTEHTHDRTGKTETGIEMILEGYRDVDGNLYSTDEVARRVIDRLIADGTIAEDKWKYKYICSHRWGSFDAEGYAHSVYKADLEIYVMKDMARRYGY